MIKQTVNYLGTLALIIAVGLFVFVAVGPHTGMYCTVTVLTNSMHGTFDRGDVIIARPHPIESIQKGDVVLFHPPGEREVVSHRIVKIKDAGTNHPIIDTKGDANNVDDSWHVQLNDPTVYVVHGHIPKLGYGISFLRGRLAHAITVNILPLCFIILALVFIWKDEAEEEDADETETAKLA